MSKGTALVKTRDRLKKNMLLFPERAAFYEEKLRETEQQIIVMKVCRRCGRPLKDEHAMTIGYGKECQAKAEAEAAAEQEVHG